MRLVFPEVRLTAVRIVWQPPEEPNGVILGKKHCGVGSVRNGREKGREICSLQFLLDNGQVDINQSAADSISWTPSKHRRPPLFLGRALRLSPGMKFTLY